MIEGVCEGEVVSAGVRERGGQKCVKGGVYRERMCERVFLRIGLVKVYYI